MEIILTLIVKLHIQQNKEVWLWDERVMCSCCAMAFDKLEFINLKDGTVNRNKFPNLNIVIGVGIADRIDPDPNNFNPKTLNFPKKRCKPDLESPSNIYGIDNDRKPCLDIDYKKRVNNDKSSIVVLSSP
eukprot:Pgem_evm1s35